METKTCTKCGEVKALACFPKDRRLKTGLRSDCTACRGASLASWKKSNRDKCKDHGRKYRANNLAKEKVRVAVYKKAHPEKRRAADVAYENANPGRATARAKEYRERLGRGYVAATLSLSVKDMPPKLFEMKQEQLNVKRLSRELKKSIKSLKENS